MRNISTHSWCLLLFGIFSCIALHITWKPPHVQCKHKMFLNFGFLLITYIPFPFSFSLLYNSSSFYQWLHFVWHLVMYKFLTKILLSPSFCLNAASLTKVKYTLSILQICWKYFSKVYLNYTSSILDHRFLPGLEPPAPLFPFSVPLSFWGKFKKSLPIFWEPSKQVHVNCKKHFKMKVLHFVLY